jgi:hypothetical protein
VWHRVRTTTLTMYRGFTGLVEESNILEWEVIIMGYVVLATLYGRTFAD